MLLAEVPQVARSGEAARVGNLLEGHVRVRQQGDHVRLPLFRQPAVRSRVQLLPEPPSQRIDRHGTFPCQLLHVFHLGQSQCDLFPERAAPQVRQVLFHLLQVRLAEHRRYALAVLGRPFTAEAEQQSRQTVAEHVQVRVFVVGVDACLHPAEEQESSAVLLPEIRLRRIQQEVRRAAVPVVGDQYQQSGFFLHTKGKDGAVFPEQLHQPDHPPVIPCEPFRRNPCYRTLRIRLRQYRPHLCHPLPPSLPDGFIH